MKRGYAGDIIPLLPSMLAGAAVDQGEGSAQPTEPHHTPVNPSPPRLSPPHPSPLHHSPPHSPPQSPPHFSPHRSYKAPLHEGNTSGSAEDSMQLKELMVLVPTLVTIEGNQADTRECCAQIGKEEDQRRKIQDIDDDPLVSLVREFMKEKSTDFVTPTKASGEAQKEEISPTILEAAKTLSKVSSQGDSKEKSSDKGKRYRRRARSMAKKIDTGLDADEEFNTGREEINTGSTKVDSGTASKRGQRKGKTSMVKEDVQASHKTKEQMRQEKAGLEEAIKLQAQMDEEVAKQIHLDKIKAKRMAEEEALTEQQNKIKAQLKKLKFVEIKEEFDKLVQQIDTFVPINLEATKAKLKRYGEELQKKTSKKQRFDDKDVPAIGDKVSKVKEEEPVKRIGKRKKQKARKGINVDKSAQEDSETDKEESVEAMNPTPLTTKSDSVVNWKIFQQGQRSIYQIMRANGADTVYMSFGAIVKDFIREDLIELYRLVMQKYGTNRPEDA
ncbi:hypothetical protein Tco_1199893 [Tanacetum coccineum]